MTSNVSTLMLLAQLSKWQRLGDGLHRSGPRTELTDLLPLAIAVVVVGIVAFVAVQLYKRQDFSKPCDDAQKMFRQLCAAHKLDFGSRRLLQKLATSLEIANPAALFVTPSAFRESTLPESLRGEQARLLNLARRLF